MGPSSPARERPCFRTQVTSQDHPIPPHSRGAGRRARSFSPRLGPPAPGNPGRWCKANPPIRFTYWMKPMKIPDPGVPLPASDVLKPAAERRAEWSAGLRESAGHRRQFVPPFAAIGSYRGGRGEDCERRSPFFAASLRSSPRRPDSSTGRKRRDVGAAMAGGFSWPRRSDGPTSCGGPRVLLGGRGDSYLGASETAPSSGYRPGGQHVPLQECMSHGGQPPVPAVQLDRPPPAECHLRVPHVVFPGFPKCLTVDLQLL